MAHKIRAAVVKDAVLDDAKIAITSHKLTYGPRRRKSGPGHNFRVARHSGVTVRSWKPSYLTRLIIRSRRRNLNQPEEGSCSVYPGIATASKIEALGGLGRYQEALTLTNDAMARVTARHLNMHISEHLRIRAGIDESAG